MSTREKRMLLFLGVLGLAGVLFGAYQLIWLPLKQAQADETRLIDEKGKKDDEVDRLRADLKRLPAAKKRSLPADIDVARREYEATLSYMLNEAGVPKGYTIVPKDGGDTVRAPELAPKKPAYTRIGYDIRMQKVELPVLAKVLKGYYDLNLLHQITHLDIKRVEKEGSSGGIARRGADRADLEVVLHTDAIILDGAEPRRTLLPIPEAVAAAGGNAAYFAMQNLPEASRRQKTQLFPSVLATDVEKKLRDYLVLEARDPYHGPLPRVEPPKAKEPEVVKEPFKAIPEDISPFIVFNGITTSSNGTRAAMFLDRSMNHLYEVSIVDNDDGKPEPRAKKYYFLRGQLKLLDRGKEFVVGENSTATNVTFKVLGFHGDGLVLSRPVTEEERTAAEKREEAERQAEAEKKAAEKAAKDGTAPKPAAPEPKRNTPRFGGGGGNRDTSKDKPSKPTKEQTAVAAAVGGVGLTKPPTTEGVYYWRIGQSLAAVKLLPVAKGQELLKAMASGETATTPPPPPESAPPPRALQN